MEKTLAQLTKLGPQPEAEDSEKAVWVWQALAEMFGRVFINSYGTVPPTTWEQAIRRLTDDQLRRGLTAIADEGRKFPPNLSEFVSACQTIPERRFNGVIDKTDYKRLKRDRSKPEVAASWIEKIKKSL